MKAYKIKTIEDIYNLPPEYHEEFISDLTEGLKQHSKYSKVFEITDINLEFKPDGHGYINNEYTIES